MWGNTCIYYSLCCCFLEAYISSTQIPGARSPWRMREGREGERERVPSFMMRNSVHGRYDLRLWTDDCNSDCRANENNSIVLWDLLGTSISVVHLTSLTFLLKTITSFWNKWSQMCDEVTRAEKGSGYDFLKIRSRNPSEGAEKMVINYSISYCLDWDSNALLCNTCKIR